MNIFTKQLINIRKYFFQVHNYGKKLEKVNITRNHGRFRYDEYSIFKTSESKLKIEQKYEEIEFKKLQSDIEPYIQKYLGPSLKRKDKRSKELPEIYGQYEYYSMHSFMGENDYEIIYRRNLITNKQELVLDIQQVIKDKYKKTAKLVKMTMSDDHTQIAFGIDLRNDEQTTFYIKNLETNKINKNILYDTYNVQFSADGKSILYVTTNDQKRQCNIVMHVLGTDSDVILYHEKDESYYLDIGVTKDKKFFIINCVTKKNSEIMVLDRREMKDLKLLFSRARNSKAVAYHSDERFFILTDIDNVYDFKVVTLSSQDFQNSKFHNLKDFYLPKQGEIITEIDLFKNFLILYITNEGNSHITVIDLQNNNNFNVQLKEKQAKISPGLNENYESSTFRFHVDTPFVYNRVYEYCLEQRKCKLLEDFDMDGPKFDQNKFTVTKVCASSHDGESIPITLIHKKKLKKDRQNKLLLHGYGHYGLSIESDFNIAYLSALENDWVIAYAHVRGGNEKGNIWHTQAIKLNKIISYQDFLSSAEYLISEGYTHPSLLCAFGSSAGGTLVATAMNMKPDLFKAVILHFPFLDVLTCLLDDQLPLTQSDHDEFGNPIIDPDIYDLIYSYSPYENIQNCEYPSVYIACGSLDYRAPLWNVMKYVKRFRDRSKTPLRVTEFCPKNIIVNVVDSGHYGDVSVASGIKDKCQYLGFLDLVLTGKNKDIMYEE